MRQVQEYEVNGVKYSPHPDHRNHNPMKSQWIITLEQELEVFRRCHSGGWILSLVGWGLHFVQEQPAYLGVAQDHQTRVLLAKFVGNEAPVVWHGYPADHTRSHDRPPTDVLNKWLKSKVLPTKLLSKIVQGKPCKLSN